MYDANDSALVSLVSEQPVASSLDVAAHFEKQHKHVLRSIERLIADLHEVERDFTEPKIGLSDRVIKRNFAFSEYLDPTGRKLPMYYMTRDGFFLLAMGFTGKKALAWKVRYIAAFNAMEKKLLENKTPDTKEKVFLAGGLRVMLDRERPERRRLVTLVLLFHEGGRRQAEIARECSIHRSTVARIIRRYAPYTSDFWWLEKLGRTYTPALEV